MKAIFQPNYILSLTRSMVFLFNFIVLFFALSLSQSSFTCSLFTSLIRSFWEAPLGKKSDIDLKVLLTQ